MFLVVFCCEIDPVMFLATPQTFPMQRTLRMNFLLVGLVDFLVIPYGFLSISQENNGCSWKTMKSTENLRKSWFFETSKMVLKTFLLRKNTQGSCSEFVWQVYNKKYRLGQKKNIKIWFPISMKSEVPRNRENPRKPTKIYDFPKFRVEAWLWSWSSVGRWDIWCIHLHAGVVQKLLYTLEAFLSFKLHFWILTFFMNFWNL